MEAFPVKLYSIMRKLLLIFTCLVSFPFAMCCMGDTSILPSVWHRPDSLITMPLEDSVSWSDEYTVFSVVRSLHADSTNECLWSFAEEDTITYAVLTKGIYSSTTGELLSHNLRDFSGWCVYAYHSGIRADSTKRRSLRLGTQIIPPHDTVPADTLHARIEMEEIAYYDNRLSKQASAAFQTYLALKYGITLDNAPYISIVGDTLWHPISDRYYYNHVVGIGNDTVHQWETHISHSKEEAVMHIQTDTLSPFEYILLGDDNGALDWYPEPDGTRAVQRIWCMRQFVKSPKDLTISLQLSALSEPADSLRLIIMDADRMVLQSVQPNEIQGDSICYFSVRRAEPVLYFRLHGTISHQMQMDESSANIHYDASNRTIIVNGFPEDQVFVLYLFDNTGKYISQLSSTTPIDISVLPNAVFQIEITTNNQIVGSIPVPAFGN